MSNWFIKVISDSIPEAIGAFIGILGALLIVQFQLKVERRKAAKNLKNEERVNSQFFAILLKSTKETVVKQIQDLNEYADKIFLSPHQQLTAIPHYPIHDLNRLILFMNDKNTLSSFLSVIGDKQENMIEYDQISKSLDYLEIGYKQIVSAAETSIKYDAERRVKYNTMVTEQMKRLRDYSIKCRPQLNQILDAINSLEYDYESSSDLSLHSNKIVIPITSLLNKLNIDDEILRDIYFELNQALILIDIIKENNIRFGSTVKEISNDFQKTLNVLSINSINLKKEISLSQTDTLELKPIVSDKLNELVVLEKGADESRSPI
jgi:hypothetical protein